ncbi:uncharacterized protein CC84DRAFT_1218808 [Paraphaeosphaeria sporulosa]|uniref:Uncharacterized protein n=1 Tax=Paraphaeosphaeria sporulosa TaxID=1460663 RepID=A0A177C9H4_9PLEO|nr:uncharacterized protein CC84DRAFT_1218808 [Paraphaeosphaeria sporulosa]OAG03489.1 hypothetical protein CC84DRAFT_1218808 [Paraphaeosphaeria sporulosa]
MCYALLTTCHRCTWLLHVTYPRCSHAKAYALDPSACPHRMRRRYKALGLCSACKHDNAHTTTTRKYGRKQSLSVTPCEVRIAFRDTEVGAVEERDRVGGMGQEMEARRESLERKHSAKGQDKGRRKIRARKGVVQSRLGSVGGEDSDGDAYVDFTSPSASVSSASSGASSRGYEALLPRKHKAGGRPGPRALPKARGQPRRRKRSPGVLERLQMDGDGGVKKKGRPPKVKMVWPDRIDAGEFEQVERERKANEQKRRAGERPIAKARKVEKQPMFGAEMKSHERPIATNRKPSRDQRQTYVSKAPELVDTSMPSYTGDTDEVDDLARIIALEAAKREKKWR